MSEDTLISKEKRIRIFMDFLKEKWAERKTTNNTYTDHLLISKLTKTELNLLETKVGNQYQQILGFSHGIKEIIELTSNTDLEIDQIEEKKREIDYYIFEINRLITLIYSDNDSKEYALLLLRLVTTTFIETMYLLSSDFGQEVIIDSDDQRNINTFIERITFLKSIKKKNNDISKRLLAILPPNITDIQAATDEVYIMIRYLRLQHYLVKYLSKKDIDEDAVLLLKKQYDSTIEVEKKKTLLQKMEMYYDFRTERERRSEEIYNIFSLEHLMKKDINATQETTNEIIKIIEKDRKINPFVLTYFSSIKDAVEAHHTYTGEHQKRVATSSELIAIELGLSENEIGMIKQAAEIHDVGKIEIPVALLNKKSSFSSEEFDILKSHSEKGAAFLGDRDFQYRIRESILQHHENIDGSGYPYGISGKNIRLESKIIRVTDSIDSMINPRSYKNESGVKYTIDELRKYSNIFWEKKIADIAIHLIEDGKIIPIHSTV